VQVDSTAPTPRPDTTALIPVDVRRFPWIRRLAADYAYDFPALAPFFAGDPADGAAWTSAIARAQAQPRRRAEISALIGAQQQRRQAPAGAVEAGRRLADAKTVAIVTGQQAGLFGGPLFTLLKALTALKLAARVSRDHGVPAVAIFWIDAEDHDWDEVRACTVLDAELTPRKVALPARTEEDATPVANVRLGESVVAALAELESVLPATEFRDRLLADLRRSYAPGIGAAEAFGRWLECVLGDRALVVYDASDSASKPLVGDVFARELSTPGTTVKLATAAGSNLASSGYHSQVLAPDDSLAIFRLDGGRRAIRAQNGQFIVGTRSYPQAALVEEAVKQPAAFSPNVLLRPIVQDSIFPTVCYVAGPNELAYLGQLRQVYEHFGVPMPLMYPRASATLVDSGTLRFLTKYQLPLEALQPRDESALNDLLKSQIPPTVEESFTDAGRALEITMTSIIQSISAVDPTLEGAARSSLTRMQHDLETLHGKMIQAAKRRDETLKRQFVRAQALAFPNGHAQEREIGFISFLNQYGPALVERLENDLPLDLGRHWIVHI
jgi:bacillithiol biosynthesis cysteine-adding enzyme BshC